jgi:hypothetical protein
VGRALAPTNHRLTRVAQLRTCQLDDLALRKTVSADNNPGSTHELQTLMPRSQCHSQRCGAVADVAGDLLRLVEPQAFLPVPSPLMTSNEIARLIFVVTSLIRRSESRRLTRWNLVEQPFGRPLTRKWKTTTASLSPGFVPIPDACAWLSAGTRQNSP